ncbi:MAG TPA: hypothetical protein HA303_00360 [Candidatus Thalassarchaeaceae archaeon]|nr:MAG TPA: hypothetical protein D7H79_00365 [Candidatus Poseidoniales archaeon]HIH79653.1 hypothetical protein [Candidatus Thalassarchaeaceae archaeon]
MLRTMIGMGLVLILVLAFAVHKNTMNSEYYRYETSNSPNSLDLEQIDENLSTWIVTTDSAITWVNVTVINAPVNSEIQVTSTSSLWYYSELLGVDGDEAFNCKEFDSISESCQEAYTHSQIIDEEVENMHGRVSLTLPIEGVGYVQAEDAETAAAEAQALIIEETVLTTWEISLVEDEEVISSEGIEVSMIIVEHEYIGVTEFELDPIQETLYSLATLIGCFGLLIFVPMIAYFAGVWKERLEEEEREEEPAPEY